ncbi:MAG: MarR family winged helix-turn-helix transcriptional regulator [Geopsychrobacter sp.]|nr:MarR family winged helix-turn-helix transcriptional regulator [Geopsychrobacter sp.]
MTEIHRLFEAVELLRKSVKKDMPSQHISILLTVSQRPGITMLELCQILEMPQGTLSRNIKILSHFLVRENGVAKGGGLGLLYTEQDLDNPHTLAVFLTDKGRTVVAELACTINPALRDGGLEAHPDYRALTKDY